MKVGIYLDLRNPSQWRQDPSRLYGFTLELCEEAERRGIDSIWVTEHHLFDDGYLPQPLTFAAAIAARTRRVRVGTAVVLAPLHHPAEIAEQAAIVDLVSGGRLDLGLGAGYRIPEFDLFGADIAHRFTTTDACVRQLRAWWASGRLHPAPVQDRMPIWLGYAGPRGARRAGLLGEGLLSIDPALVAPYAQGLADGGHDVTSGRTAGVFSAWLSHDPDRATPIVAPFIAHQLDSYRRHLVEGTGAPSPRPVDMDRVLSGSGGRMASFTLGTPADVAAAVRRRTDQGPVDTVFFWASVGGMPEDLVTEHLALLCDELAPRLRADDQRADDQRTDDLRADDLTRD